MCSENKLPPENLPFEDHEEYRDTVSTIDTDGKRVWIYPKKPKGNFYDYRKYVSYILLAVLFGMPWIKWNGKPLMLFNILETKFIIFVFVTFFD